MITEFRDEYRWLSNFAPVKIVFDGIEYASVEHAYMSAKSDSMEWKSKCADKQMSAGKIKRESQAITLRPDWEDVKVTVMNECLIHKFNQSPFREKLLGTRLQEIQEGNTWNDTFWGVDIKTGEGKNMLGKLIMDIRDELFIDMIYIWNHSQGDDMPIHKFIGLSEEEYKIFVK